jgi:uncharacterized protein
MIDFLLIALTALLCAAGILVSALAFSGTWIVLSAAIITFFAADFPSLGTVILFVLLCIGAEVLEALAGWFGIRKRGGSRAAGLAAVAGGLLGAVFGSVLLPILGTFFGMLAGSFSLAFLAEWSRLKHHGDAAKIASGALLARLAVLFLKTALTLAMSAWLLTGLIRL